MDYLKIPNVVVNRVAFMLLAMVAASAHAEVVVIVSDKSPVTSLTAEQTAKIFLGKTTNFPNDGTAFPVDQVEGSEVRKEFYEKVVHKNPTQLSAYWARVIFTGNGQPPVELEGNITVRSVVAKNRNAIGYIDKRYLNRSVRVVLTVGKK
ncbi:MAG TPA: phosphate ABC transporter substrate-binding protein [Gallionella sp.]|nr:phosphate ABC transporter substrate-binding protein [Gallionella sp.]